MFFQLLQKYSLRFNTFFGFKRARFGRKAKRVVRIFRFQGFGRAKEDEFLGLVSWEGSLARRLEGVYFRTGMVAR